MEYVNTRMYQHMVLRTERNKNKEGKNPLLGHAEKDAPKMDWFQHSSKADNPRNFQSMQSVAFTEPSVAVAAAAAPGKGILQWWISGWG